MAITKITTPDLIDLPFNNTDGIVLAKGSTISQNLTVDYLIIAGGGGGGGNNSGGGGAGGYLTSYDSDLSGDSSATLNALSLSISTPYTATIGAGGAGVASGIPDVNGGIGSDSDFATLTADGGGCGRASGGAAPGDVDGGSGGGGGYGAAASQPKGVGTALQGGDGSDGVGGSPYNGGGGGGASGNSSGINGANGLVSTIDGGSTTRAGGGGGGQDPNSPSSGGTGGGGAGGTQSFNGGVGPVNTGSGGGGGGYTTGSSGGAGGSGIIILRYPNIFTATYTAGTGGTADSEVTVGTDKYIKITAGTGTISFSGTPTVGRPTTNLSDGEFRYNTTTKKVEYYDGAKWFALTSTTAVPQAGTTGACNYPTTASALYQLNSDGGVANNVPDTCGSYDGTATSITYSTGNFGNAAVFNGSSSYITLPNSVEQPFILAQQFAVSIWFNIDALPTGGDEDFLISLYEEGYLDIRIKASGVIEAKVAEESSGTDRIVTSSSGVVSASTWHNVIWTGAANNLVLYVDGSSVATGSTWNGTFYHSNAGCSIGSKNNGTSNFFDGKIDQCRIFPSALTSAQVTALYEETAP